MKILLTIFTFLLMNASYADTVKVAVIDTGFDFQSTWSSIESEKTQDGKSLRRPKICKSGHKDFSGNGMGDSHGHGTHVAGIIGTYAEDADYCLIIIKYMDPRGPTNNQRTTVKSIEYAISLNVDVINYSSGGDVFDYDEYKAIQKALDKGIVIVTAAGNESRIINSVIYNVKRNSVKEGELIITVTYTNLITLEFDEILKVGYYPANYDKRIYSVVNLLSDGVTISHSSNRGVAFTHSEIGTNVKSILPGNRVGPMSGSSQAAPKITAKIIKGLQNKK